MLRVVIAVGPGEGVDLQRQAEALGGGLDRPQALGHDFFADAVAGDGGDLENVGHDCSSLEVKKRNGNDGRRPHVLSTIGHPVK
ncbi:hypothetical protein D9M70_602380 [compost metagenome]